MQQISQGPCQSWVECALSKRSYLVQTRYLFIYFPAHARPQCLSFTEQLSSPQCNCSTLQGESSPVMRRRGTISPLCLWSEPWLCSQLWRQVKWEEEHSRYNVVQWEMKPWQEQWVPQVKKVSGEKVHERLYLTGTWSGATGTGFSDLHPIPNILIFYLDINLGNCPCSYGYRVCLLKAKVLECGLLQTATIYLKILNLKRGCHKLMRAQFATLVNGIM